MTTGCEAIDYKVEKKLCYGQNDLKRHEVGDVNLEELEQWLIC
jgi:hypothetical protein